MSKTANIHRWASPELFLVATNLKDGPHLMAHVISQARLSDAKVLLAHVVKPAYLRTNPEEGVPLVLPSPSLHSVQGQMNQYVKQAQREGVLCEPIALKGLPQEQLLALVEQRKVERVIAGTRSAESLERIFFGSVAEDLYTPSTYPFVLSGRNSFRRFPQTMFPNPFSLPLPFIMNHSTAHS